MSSKHYFPSSSATSLVPRYLSALVREHPQLELIPSQRVVYNPSHDRSCVAVISGGGSEHEPSWSGFVGDGLLAAAVCGDIFASPSTKQVLAAVDAVPSDAGVILMITNYTGDKLHFGLAAERAKAAGTCGGGRIAVLPSTDDVSIGRSRTKAVGRRGMPGHVITLKIVGAAAASKRSFDECVAIGLAVNDQLVSIGSSLDHCHVPGRENHESLGDDACAIGAGIHNEPAQQEISPFPSVEDVVDRCLRLLCDPADTERAFVDFSNVDDSIVLLVNNYGGLSNLELGALTDEVLRQLEANWRIRPVTNGDLPKPHISEEEDIRVDARSLDALIRGGCTAAIAAEPDLTRWDMVMGDGDCGEAVKRVCEALVSILDKGAARGGSLLKLLFAASDAVDDMGGTLGAILGILLSAFITELRLRAGAGRVNQETVAKALQAAVEVLKKHTAAREGDRTVMDVLLPFAEAFSQSFDFQRAVNVAMEKAEATRYLKPKFGRATYVGKEEELPDPGAWALAVFLRGMWTALQAHQE
ncbi:87ec389b-72fe-4f1f-bfb6-35a73704d50d [Thermothielavioides terrestris]|uniref:87ec389b-72fe-4f1f-bfb6-35a73704d50d n=1 Tax=Thermothielavioides terrestris TaxID=2587410 RepID=A0A446BFY4_9PEZI|nr:87ec389b-72fe-4f1f-bfb6-35a73704d50d [Thermothielavioides terrestris]